MLTLPLQNVIFWVARIGEGHDHRGRKWRHDQSCTSRMKDAYGLASIAHQIRACMRSAVYSATRKNFRVSLTEPSALPPPLHVVDRSLMSSHQQLFC
eukprot:6626493-Prymnesium_polylepis.1